MRNALLRATRDRSAVTRIVGDGGFWEFGRCAVEYRALFGDAPDDVRCGPSHLMPVIYDGFRRPCPNLHRQATTASPRLRVQRSTADPIGFVPSQVLAAKANASDWRNDIF